jgi:hypothetical protein
MMVIEKSKYPLISYSSYFVNVCIVNRKSNSSQRDLLKKKKKARVTHWRY